MYTSKQKNKNKKKQKTKNKKTEGCPSSSITLKSGIESMLMHYIEEVREVIAVDQEDAEEAQLNEISQEALMNLEKRLGER